MSRLDFVNLPDERIIRLFAQKESNTIKELIKELLPPACRRTGAQIREFVRVSKDGKKQLHNKYANYRINTTSSISYQEYVEEESAKVEKANTANVATVKDSSDADELHVETEVSLPSTCTGITLEYLRNAKTDSEERRSKRLLGFKHAC
eukprot:scaffold89640_cov23-Cyclotella_meneghiniana.AAC.1